MAIAFPVSTDRVMRHVNLVNVNLSMELEMLALPTVIATLEPVQVLFALVLVSVRSVRPALDNFLFVTLICGAS